MEERVEIHYAGESDVPVIMSIIESVWKLVQDASWYCADDEPFVKQHIKEEGFILKAMIDGILTGFLIVRYPKEAEDNLGVYLGLSVEEMQHVAHMESVAVHPDYTGRSIQRMLMARGEELLKDTPYTYLMGTAHPENIYSVNNFCRLGYEIIAEEKKYGGWPRYVFCKDIHYRI